MNPNFHPQPDTLISYAAGTLPNAISCVVACHISMCTECAQNVRRLEFLGGLMLKNLEPAASDNTSIETAAAEWPADNLVASDTRNGRTTIVVDPMLPAPLASYLRMRAGDIPWTPVVEGVQQYWIKLPKGSGQMRLLRLAPGKLLNEHSRNGSEVTLVLQGVYGDQTGDYFRGDVIEGVEGTMRQRHASGTQECICLIARDASSSEYRDMLQSGLKAILPERSRTGVRKLSPMLAAAAVAVVAGIGLGWLLHGNMGGGSMALDDLVRIESNRLLAKGLLQKALESLPSGTETAALASEGRKLRLGVKMTFQDQNGDYCREYQIAAASPARYAGVACRVGQQWIVKIQALVPPSRNASEQMIPAGGNADGAIDTVVASLIQGDPLVGPDEDTLLKQGWAK
jgi:putative transcriptional regulator